MSTETAETGPVVSDEIRDGWEFLVGVGVVIGALGVLAIAFPFVTGIALSLLLGAVLVVGSVFHVAHAFSAGGWKGAVWQVVLGVVYLVAGLSLMSNPLLGLATLTLLLVAFLLVDGVVEVAMGLRLRPERGWAWVVGSGVIGVVLAGLIWTGWPSSALWAVGLLFGVNLLVTGLSMVAVGVGARRAGRAAPAPAAGAGGP